MTEILETLVTRFTADLSPLQSGLQQAEQAGRATGLQVAQELARGLRSGLSLQDLGLQAGQQLGEGFKVGVDGKIRDAKGRFVKAGQELGQGLTAGLTGALTSGLMIPPINTTAANTSLNALQRGFLSATNEYKRFTSTLNAAGASGVAQGLGDAAKATEDLTEGLSETTQAGVNTVATMIGLAAAITPVSGIAGIAGASFLKLNTGLQSGALTGGNMNVVLGATATRAQLAAAQVQALADAQAALNAAAAAGAAGPPPGGPPPPGPGPTPPPGPGPGPTPPTGAAGAWASLTASVGAAAGVFGVVTAAIGTVTAAFAAVLVPMNAAINKFTEFEYSLAQVSTLTDKLPSQLKTTGQSILNMSSELGMSFTDLSSGLQDILGAGVRGTEDMTAALGFLKDASKLAIAGNTDTAVATDALTSVMNAYAMKAGETKKVSDNLFQAVLDGKMSFNQLAGSIGMVTAISADAKVPLQTVLASLATMTANGVQASSSVDYLRSMIAAIISPSEEAKKTAKALNIEFNAQALASKGLVGVLRDVMTATKGNKDQMGSLLGGVEAVTAATSISSNNFERMTANMKNQANAAGATERAYEKMAGTLKKANDKVDADWARLMVNLGEAFAPFKVEVLSGIASMLDGFNRLIEKRNLIRGINDIDAEIGDQKAIINNNAREKASLLQRAEAAAGSPLILNRLRDRIEALDRETIAARTRLKELEAQAIQARADQTAYNFTSGTPDGMTREGPQMGGTAAGPEAYTADTNSTAYQSNVAMQALRATGVRTADQVVDYCAQWVRLTLGKADAKVAPIINKLFQTDNNRDGNVTANDAAANVRAAGLMKQYGGIQDLRPGDTVFYEDGGAGHVGIYIGGGMVRGNNRVSAAATGNPVGNVAIDRLGTVTGFARSSELAGFKGEIPNTGNPMTDDGQAAKNRAALQKEIDAAVAAGKVQAAQRALTELKRIQGEELRAAGENAAARAAVITRSGPQIIAAEAQIARAVRNQAVQAAGQWAKEQLEKDGADKAKIEAERVRRVRVAYADEAQAGRQARTAQAQAAAEFADAARDDAERRAKEQSALRARVANEARELTVKAAQDTLNRTAELNRQELAAFKGTSAERVALVKRQADDVYAAQERAARAVRDKTLAENAIGSQQNRAALDAAAKRAYDQAVLEASGGRTDAVRAAQDAETQAVRTLRTEYKNLADGVRERIAAGTFDETARREALKSFNNLSRAAKEAGLYTNEYAQGARQAAYALIDQGVAASDLIRLSGERIAQIKAQGDLEAAQAEDAQTTIPVLTGMLAELIAQDLNPRETGFVKLLDELISKGGQAGRAAQYVRDNLLDLEVDMGSQTPEAIRARGARALADARAANNPELPSEDTVTLEQSTANSRAAQVIDRAFNQPQTIGGRITAALTAAFSDSFSDLGTEGREAFWARFETLADDPEVGNMGAGMARYLLGRLTDAPEFDALRARLVSVLDVESETNTGTGAAAVEAAEELAQRDVDAALELLEGTLTDLYAAAGNGEDAADGINLVTDAINRLTDARTKGEAGGLADILSDGNAGAAKSVIADADALAGDGQYADALSLLEDTLTDLWVAAENGEDAAEAINLVTDAINKLTLAQGKSDAKTAADNATKLKEANRELEASQRALNVAMGEKEQPYADQIRGLEDLREKIVGAGGATDAIDKLIAAWQQLQKQAQLTDLAGQIASAAQGMGELFDKISGSDAKGALSILGDYMQMNVTAYKQFQSGDVVGAVMTSLNGILNIGESIAELNSGLREWKKNLREVAQEQSKALGMSTGGIKSPWQDALKADMEAQEKLANSKWYQRLAWSIFGGAPQAMKTESAKALAEMQTIFAGFAEGFSGILTNTLTDAFNKGDMAGWAENFSKSFDAQVGQLILKTIIQAAFETGAAANDLGELTKAVKEERYGDIPPILTRLKATAGNIGAGIAAIAPSLPGYGAGADDSGTGVGGGVMFGSTPGASLGLARVELTLPPIFTAAMDTFSGAAPVFAEGSNTLLRAARLIEDAFKTNGPPRLSGNGGLT